MHCASYSYIFSQCEYTTKKILFNKWKTTFYDDSSSSIPSAQCHLTILRGFQVGLESASGSQGNTAVVVSYDC